jgi:phenylalanyl-tRNA synthetase beta chain
VCYSLATGDLFREVSPWTDEGPIFIENRAGHENTFVRTSLIPSLLQVRKTNEDRKVERPDVYEVAHVYLPSDGEVPEQPLMVAMAASVDFGGLKGVLEKLLPTVGADGAVFEACSTDFLAEGAAARIMLNGAVIGYAGVLAEALKQRLDLSEETAVAEIRLTGLERPAHEVAAFEPLKRFPGVERDLAVVVSEGTLWADIVRCVEGAGVEHLERIGFASLYRGDPIPDGRKSIAFHVVFRSAERTLTGEEADRDQATIVAALERDLGASLR